MITDNMLKNVKKHYEGTNIDYEVVRGEIEFDDWLTKNRPRTIIEVEQAYGFIAAVDTSYGICLLFNVETDELIALGRYEATGEDVIMLDKEYHGVKKYIWR